MYLWYKNIILLFITLFCVLHFCKIVMPIKEAIPYGGFQSINQSWFSSLFLNDIIDNIADKIDPKTNFLMYADDTKIWHEINCEEDHHVLQRDIDSLKETAL